jgi:hypothetical protein
LFGGFLDTLSDYGVEMNFLGMRWDFDRHGIGCYEASRGAGQELPTGLIPIRGTPAGFKTGVNNAQSLLLTKTGPEALEKTRFRISRK